MQRLTTLLLLVLALGGADATAQDKYPAKPVKVVVPFGPGSATDIVMRIVGEQMRLILGQPLLIENKPGAFGILAIEEMARSRPDGYTLQIGNPGTNVLTPIIYKKKFKIDYDKDVTLVTRLSEVPLVLGATTKDFPAKTYAEFIAYAKANPGKVRYASVGVGSNNHYDMEAFARWAGLVVLGFTETYRALTQPTQTLAIAAKALTLLHRPSPSLTPTSRTLAGTL
jgi:tripartite-type tricarboxylate transporter receptor subunit TctC